MAITTKRKPILWWRACACVWCDRPFFVFTVLWEVFVYYPVGHGRMVHCIVVEQSVYGHPFHETQRTFHETFAEFHLAVR